MKIRYPNTKRQDGFSLVETMIVIAVIAILALIAVATVTKVKPAAELSKLQSDVQNLNTAIKIYKHSGGSLSSTNSVDEVIAKLKTIRSQETAKSFVGFTGSMLDPRTEAYAVDGSVNGGRAVYDSNRNSFSITSDSVPGFRFRLDVDAAPATVEELRDRSALEFANTGSWVWDYEDVEPPSRLSPTSVNRISVPAPTGGQTSSVGQPINPQAPELRKLLPPTFSLPSDFYDIGSFSLSVAIDNPNDSGTSKIVYGIINRDGWQWTDYTGPVSVGPGDKILAFVESLNPREFHHSDPADEQYDWTAALQDPTISVSENEIEARSGSTTVTISHENDESFYEYQGRELPISGNAFIVEYRLVPLGDGQGAETPWTAYNGPFDIGGPQFPRGFQVLSRVRSTSPNFNDSGIGSTAVSAYYELEPPTVSSSRDALTDPEQEAVITLTNPNPSGSSRLVYDIVNEAGAVVSGDNVYASPFSLSGRDYPQGFSIAAKATPLDPYYRESGYSNLGVTANFLGLELTGRTIFVLDTSNSMSRNRRLQRLRTATAGALRSLNEDSRYAIVNYDQNATVLTSWGPGTASRIEGSVAAINTVSTALGTNYHAAIQSTIGIATSEVNQVIFLSDGMPFRIDLPRDQRDTQEGLPELVQQLVDMGIRFDTVSLGGRQDVLEGLAAIGGGRSVNVDD